MKKKRILCSLLTLAMLMALLTVTAFAEGEEALTLPPEGGTLASGTYQLREDLTISSSLNIPSGNDITIDLNGHTLNTAAAKLAGWTDIPATVMTVNDQRAISIAIATNLLRRQDLTIIERGKAYKALLDARNRHGFRTDLTSGESRQKYSARGIVAEFFGVTEYEIRKAVKLAQLIPPLAEIVENEPKKLNLACADLIADYDESAQTAFIEMCQIDGYALNKQTTAFIQAQCPPPSADQQAIYAAWREAREKATSRAAAPPKKLSFDRKRFAPYLSKFKSDKEIEDLFLEFLRQRAG